MARFGHVEIATLIAVTHAGITSDAFEEIARTWLATAQHPRYHRLYKECLYQPQLELLAYLRANGFKLFIVTGGGIDFVRSFAEEAYGIPSERVIGSSTKTRFEIRAGRPDVFKLPEIGSIDDGEGKPVNINLHIGSARSWPSATPTATFRCSNLPQAAAARGSRFWCITMTPLANLPTIATLESDISKSSRRRSGRRLDGRQHEKRLAHHLPNGLRQKVRTLS